MAGDRSALRLPPYSPLRPVRQRRARPEPGAGAGIARCRRATGRHHRCRQRQRGANAHPAMPLLRRTHDHHRNLHPEPVEGRARRSAPRAATTARDGNLMMVRSRNPDTARPYRRRPTGHGTVSPDPPPGRLNQRQSMIKAGATALYTIRPVAPTCQTVIGKPLSRRSKSITQSSNPHRLCKPIHRA